MVMGIAHHMPVGEVLCVHDASPTNHPVRLYYSDKHSAPATDKLP